MNTGTKAEWDASIREVAREELERIRRSSRPGWTTRKRDRPRCGIPCKSTGKPCQARVVWDRARNAPLNGRCQLHARVPTNGR